MDREGKALQGLSVTSPGSPGQMNNRTNLQPSAYGRNNIQEIFSQLDVTSLSDEGLLQHCRYN